MWMNNLRLAECMSMLTNQFPESTERFKFSIEWNEEMFKSAKEFYYSLFIFYLGFMIALYNLITQDLKTKGKGEEEWSNFDYVSYTFVIIYTLFSTV
jgi:hypothetical protein